MVGVAVRGVAMKSAATRGAATRMHQKTNSPPPVTTATPEPESVDLSTFQGVAVK